MPWKKTDELREQQKFIVAWQGEAHTPFSELCRRFGISRKSGYKRIARFNEFGLRGIGDLSSAPLVHPNRTPAEVVEILLRAKRSNMILGPKKLVVMLAGAHPEIEFPAASTASDILKANGLVIPRRRSRKSAPWAEPFSDARRPNDIWCADFKGWFLTGDRVRCNPLTISDATSRYLINCTGLLRPNYEQVRPIFE
ncbi:MAG: IS481 family transposase, partial [Chloroflexi bacterium]